MIWAHWSLLQMLHSPHLPPITNPSNMHILWGCSHGTIPRGCPAWSFYLFVTCRNKSPDISHKKSLWYWYRQFRLERSVCSIVSYHRKGKNVRAYKVLGINKKRFWLYESWKQSMWRNDRLLDRSCDELEFEGEIYDELNVKRIGYFCTPKVSFVYLNRKGKNQQHHNLIYYMQENEYNQFCIGRQRIHETNWFHVKARQHANEEKLKQMNVTYNMVRDEEIENSIYKVIGKILFHVAKLLIFHQQCKAKPLLVYGEDPIIECKLI